MVDEPDVLVAFLPAATAAIGTPLATVPLEGVQAPWGVDGAGAQVEGAYLYLCQAAHIQGI